MSNTKSEADTRVPVIKIRRIQTHLPYFQNIERSFSPIVYIMLSKETLPPSSTVIISLRLILTYFAIVCHSSDQGETLLKPPECFLIECQQ